MKACSLDRHSPLLQVTEERRARRGWFEAMTQGVSSWQSTQNKVVKVAARPQDWQLHHLSHCLAQTWEPLTGQKRDRKLEGQEESISIPNITLINSAPHKIERNLAGSIHSCSRQVFSACCLGRKETLFPISFFPSLSLNVTQKCL